jgi:hypothetical protein
VIDKNRVRLNALDSAEEQGTRDGTEREKWFNLKLATESHDLWGWQKQRSLEARVGFEPLGVIDTA